MKYITYKDLEIEGVHYNHINDLIIEQKVGEHSKAYITLEVSESDAKGKRYIDEIIEIKQKNSGKCLFYGVVIGCIHVKEFDYPAIIIEASSMSIKLDLEPVTKTYQRKGYSYQQLMDIVAGKAGHISYGITDSPINSWIYRNNETSWDFIKRLASQNNASVFTNMTTKIPVISIGKTGKLLGHEPEIIENYEENGKIVSVTNEILEIGIEISKRRYITYVKTFLQRGLLITQYIVGDKDSIKQPVYYNSQSECKMITGTVKKVEGNKVQVFFDSIDSDFDTSGDFMFEYLTPYASTFYCMPEEGDKVRVFLPSADEGKAFAFSAVSDSTMSKTNYVQWKMPGQQQILFTDKGVRISCEGESVYIDMKDSDGIKVWSNSGIVMEKADNVEIEGKRGVTLYADDFIGICASDAAVQIENDKIVLKQSELRLEN